MHHSYPFLFAFVFALEPFPLLNAIKLNQTALFTCLCKVSGPAEAIIANLVETVSQKEKFILKLVEDFLTLKNSTIDATIRGNNSRADAHAMSIEISVQLQKQVKMQQELSDFCKKAAFFEQTCAENGFQAILPKLPTSGLIITEKGYMLPPSAKGSHLREIMSDPVLEHTFQQSHKLLEECQSKMAFDAAYTEEVFKENKMLHAKYTTMKSEKEEQNLLLACKLQQIETLIAANAILQQRLTLETSQLSSSNEEVIQNLQKQIEANERQKNDALEYATLFQTQVVQKDKEIQDLYAYHDIQITKLNKRYLELQERHSLIQAEADNQVIALQEKTELHTKLKENYIQTMENLIAGKTLFESLTTEHELLEKTSSSIISELKDANVQMLNRINTFGTQLALVEEAKNTLAQRNSLLTDTIAKLQIALDSKQRDLDKLKRENADLAKSLLDMSETAEARSSELQKLDNISHSLVALTTKWETQNARIETVERELEAAKQTILLKQAQTVKLTASKTTHLQRIDELLHLNARLATEMTEISEQSESQEKARKKISAENAKLTKEQVMSLKQEIKQLRKDRKDFLQREKEYTKKIQVDSDEISILQGQLLDKERLLGLFKSKIREVKSNSEAEISALKLELKSAKEQAIKESAKKRVYKSRSDAYHKEYKNAVLTIVDRQNVPPLTRKRYQPRRRATSLPPPPPPLCSLHNLEAIEKTAEEKVRKMMTDSNKKTWTLSDEINSPSIEIFL